MKSGNRGLLEFGGWFVLLVCVAAACSALKMRSPDGAEGIIGTETSIGYEVRIGKGAAALVVRLSNTGYAQLQVGDGCRVDAVGGDEGAILLDLGKMSGGMRASLQATEGSSSIECGHVMLTAAAQSARLSLGGEVDGPLRIDDLLTVGGALSLGAVRGGGGTMLQTTKGPTRVHG